MNNSSTYIAKLYNAHWKNLCRYIQANFGSGPPEPEDVAQAVFTKFAENHQPQAIENPKAYLYAAARNYVLDARRRDKRHEKQDLALAEQNQDILSDLSPEHVLLDRERFKLFTEALEKMPAQRRRMILLNRFEGLTCDEIGERFGMKGSAVQKQIVRALSSCVDYINSATSNRRR